MSEEKLYKEKELLQLFDPIYLDQMADFELMNRVDTKFVLSRSTLNEILPELAKAYWALEVEGTKLSAYKTQYFDTSDFNFYLDHHNGRGNRFKVRIRKYVESGIYYLEIKRKFKGRTVKKRIKIGDFEDELSAGSKEFIQAVLEKEVGLEHKLFNTFDRMTLVSKTDKERLTIDLNLSYETKDEVVKFENVVIAELKQERFSTDSLFYKLMKKNIIRPNGFSKYCFGAITLNDQLKYNNFKEKKLLIDKLD
ncbi:polyphosphate polymerase domain-containing protein [Paracrocinitomix mangrovi]|uniref:polyphosphate polymerase domain-containing protein n=1 Tax=Paracrocinitomix mangrovi TaxID=2862509 RepID=UPI001C8DBD64|nr:polyphosphate polymerase domain-containing protein [Paracrocinitomix mangrovi]UKN03231.1 polyphosphate polymerase domain-containing protein [Paracrocinitomix mangrovi]